MRSISKWQMYEAAERKAQVINKLCELSRTSEALNFSGRVGGSAVPLHILFIDVVTFYQYVLIIRVDLDKAS